MTVTDFPDFAVSQDRANKIAATGAPLINLDTLIANGVTQTTAANSGTSRGPYIMSQVSYELGLNVQCASATAGVVVVNFIMTWTDSTSGLVMAKKSYQLVAGPNGTDHQVKIQGPAHGDTLNILIHNNAASAVSVLTKFTLLSSSRLFTHDVVRTTVYAQNGFTSASPIPEYGILGNLSPSVNAAATATRLLAAYSGRIFVAANTSSLLTDMLVTIAEAATGTPLLANDGVIWQAHSDGQGLINQFVTLPNIQCVMTLMNNNAAVKTLSAVITIEESSEA